MPKPSTPLLRWSEDRQVYELSTDGYLQQRFGSENGQSWLTFLEANTSFAFQGREGRLSVIKETRPRGTGYWYAYRSLGRRTAKRYLGRSSNVTMQHLEAIAGALTRAIREPQTLQESRDTPALPPPLTSLLLPKLLPPRLPSSLVERPRLFARLDAALEQKLTLLVAPAGFGKTTLITQWIARHHSERAFPALAWVSLESGDDDLFRFWRAVIVACQTLQKNLGQAAFALLSEAFHPPYDPPPLETVLTFLLNDLAQQVQSGLLVLDDYHTITEPAIHETLTFFVEHLPTTQHVLLLSRGEPPLPVLRWRARGEIFQLHTADLRFSLEETATFLRQIFSITLSDAALTQLDASLQGWIAGLRLLTLTVPKQMTARAIEQALASLSQHAEPSSPYRPLLDYLVLEILKAQPEQLQHFLLQTSILARLSGPLCDAVTGEENSAAQLEAVEQAGLFLEALDGAGGWYRFHPLFAEALRREATDRLGDEIVWALSLRASHWYEQHAMTVEAIEAALLAHDFERAALLIEQGSADSQSSELHMVRRWLSSLPEAVLRAHPMLCWLAALSLQALQEKLPMPPADSRMEVLLQAAEEGWRHQGELAFLGLILALRAMHAWRKGTFPRAAEYAQQALAQLSNDTQDTRSQVFRGICLFIVGTAQMYQGQFADARLSLQEGHACSLVGGDRHITRSMILLLGVCSYALGELYQAHEYYQLALSDARKQEDREIIAQALLGLATIAFAWNQLSCVEQQANEVLASASEEDVDLRNSAAFQLALLSYARGQITSAQQQIAALLARLQVTATQQAMQMLPTALVWQARLLLETGDFQNAARSVETLEREEQMEARLFQARLRLAEGNPHEALLQLERLLPLIQERQDVFNGLEIQVLLSLAHAACQQDQQAQQWLRQALSQARVGGFIRPFLSEGEPLARLLRRVLPTLREPALRSYGQSILRAFTQTSGENTPFATRATSLLVEPLSPQEQRVLRLLVAGHTNLQIAQELVVSVNTVKDHVKHLYRKLGVNNRLQAGETARQLKLFDL